MKSTYKFAKGELARDIKNNPTTRKAYEKSRKVGKFIKKPKIKSIKRGKSVSTAKALTQLKKSAPKRRYKRTKYKKKPISQIKSETFSIRLR